MEQAIRTLEHIADPSIMRVPANTQVHKLVVKL
jgi:hypothetical protein